ncbi:thioredoxin family protein [Pararhodospirillum oryzae]|uniref:Thioredoxin family protein n=1 Tax=Pararhodospirillum oryzae TaxID=478448 RepID=A0A512HBZ6_9PROT|nr:thioredoxin family protein [Pararhodospirillum oryzae]GEO82963.1 thioredoxin family protein [Pararhodospirillum oryzae]
MARTETPAVDTTFHCPPFTLPDPEGRPWSRDQVMGPRGLLVAFLCNHCPYVKAVVDRFVVDARRLLDLGVGVVAIMPNDFQAYPDDAPPRMAEFARDHAFAFPYLVDESQAVARAFQAVCTPDFFGFEPGLALRYRGRLDEGRKDPPPVGCRRDLLEAMSAVAADPAHVPDPQWPSMGCSLKWRSDDEAV